MKAVRTMEWKLTALCVREDNKIQSPLCILALLAAIRLNHVHTPVDSSNVCFYILNFEWTINDLKARFDA